MSDKRDILNQHSGAMSSLAEMSYRRNDGRDEHGNADGEATITSHINTLEGYKAFNPLESRNLSFEAELERHYNWEKNINGDYDTASYIEDQYGLTVDPVDRGDGLTHFYTDNGFSAFVTIREDDPTTDVNEEAVVITYRGTDMADNTDGVMMDYVTDTLTAITKSDTKEEFVESLENPSGVRGAFKWVKDVLRSDENEVGDETYVGYSRRDVPLIDKDGNVSDIGHTQHVDPGDWFANVKLGEGTYSETQYDDAKALYELVSDHVADGRPIVSNGQSLGGGLAGLSGAEHGHETHTFGMAPFKNQLHIIGQRNAALEMVRGPVEIDGQTLDFSNQFGELTENVDRVSVHERLAFERKMAYDLNKVMTNDPEKTDITQDQAIAQFNKEWGAAGVNIDASTIEAFKDLSEEREENYNDFAQSEAFTASTVAYEFTTNATDGDETTYRITGGSALGAIVEFGAEPIVEHKDMHIVKLGADMTDYLPDPSVGQRFMRESLVRHSPSFTETLRNSADRGELDKSDFTTRSDYAGGEFSEIFRDNAQFKYAAFHKPGTLGGVTRGKEGADDDNSASRSEMPTNETVYRALSISERGDDDLYNYSADFFLQTAHSEGRITEGADAIDPNDLNLSNGVNLLGMQVLRDEVSGLSYKTLPTGDDVQFAGDYRQTGYAEIDLTKIVSEQNANFIQDKDGVALPNLEGIRGVDSVQAAIVDEVTANMEPDILYSRSGAYVARSSEDKAEAITGARRTSTLDLDLKGFPIPHLRPKTVDGFEVKSGELEFSTLVVQTGKTKDLNINLNNLTSANPDNKRVTAKGAAVFTGDGNDNIQSGEGRDYALLGDGNDTYIGDANRGDLVVGGKGFDQYYTGDGTGPVYVSVDDNVTLVTSRAAFGSDNGGLVQDQLISVEQVKGGDTSEVFSIENLSENRYIDGAGGDDKLYFGELGKDFKLNTADGVSADGQAYTATISDGTTTLYVINIDDDNLFREKSGGVEAWTPEDTSQDAKLNGAAPSVPLTDAIQMLADDARTLNANPALSEWQIKVRDAVNHPDAAKMYENLQLNGVETVPAEIESNMDADIRASKLLTAGTEASHEANISLPQEQRAELSRAEDNNNQYAHEDYEHDMLG